MSGDRIGFRGKLAFLSNFYRSYFVIDGIVYSTVEHFYQSQKMALAEHRDLIINASTAKEAKLLGKKFAMIKNWEREKIYIMAIGVYEKFKQNKILKEKLIALDNTKLVEYNVHGDVYWGVDANTGKGLNMLGKILKEVKNILISEENNGNI